MRRRVQLGAAVLAHPTLETFNHIPIKAMRADAVTELSLIAEEIGVAGSVVVAGLVPVMSSVTSLSLRQNSLGNEGAEAL